MPRTAWLLQGGIRFFCSSRRVGGTEPHGEALRGQELHFPTHHHIFAVP
jgi:hypothetical protein